MSSQRLLSTGQVCALLGTTTKEGTFPRKTIDNWCRQGILRPVAGGNGTGNHRLFNLLPDVLAITIGRGLRGKGFSSAAAGNVMQKIKDHAPDTLLELFAQGRGHLMLFRDEVAPLFSTEAEVREEFQRFQAEAPEWLRMAPTAINVAHLYDNIVSLLDRMDKDDVESTEEAMART